MAFDPNQPFEVEDNRGGFRPFDPSASFEVLDDGPRDPSIPVPRDPAPTEPRRGFLARIQAAVESPWGPESGPLGGITDTRPLSELTPREQLGRAVVGGPLVLWDQTLRTGTAALRGLGAVAGGAYEALGGDPTWSDRLERDVGTIAGLAPVARMSPLYAPRPGMPVRPGPAERPGAPPAIEGPADGPPGLPGPGGPSAPPDAPAPPSAPPPPAPPPAPGGPGLGSPPPTVQIGRASCRERV